MLGKLPVPERHTIWNTVGQGPAALAVGAGAECLDIFTLICPFFSLSPSLWETARYRLKYCLKGPLNPNNQPTNHRILSEMPAFFSQTLQSGFMIQKKRFLLIDCFGLNSPLNSISVCIGPSPKEREKEERKDR